MSRLLVLNTGSSSVKFRLFDFAEEIVLLAGGKVTDIGGAAMFSAQEEGEPKQEHPLAPNASHEEAIDLILTWLTHRSLTIRAAAHRIVHGGEKFFTATRLDDSSLDYLRSLSPLAPLHQPHNLAAVDILQKRQPDMPQYGCFDTAFHARHDPLFHEFALPETLREKGIKRYGFHGLSYDWIDHSLKSDYPHLYAGKVVAAHLGNGASLCALRNGQSIDTTMGMTALDGLPMGSRVGAIDAGAVIYMLNELNMSVDEVEKILYNESGLKGLSGLSNDVKILSESTDKNAKFALEYFALKTAQYIAAMAVSIGGMDGLIFTGGIGENAENVRRWVLDHLAHLPDFELHIIPANEERAMAQDIWENFKSEITA